MDLISEQLVSMCRDQFGFTKNQMKIIIAVVTSEKILVDIAKELGIAESSIHETLQRVEKKCPGFRQRLRDLRMKDVPDAKQLNIGSLNSDMLTDKDVEKLYEAGLYTYVTDEE